MSLNAPSSRARQPGFPFGLRATNAQPVLLAYERDSEQQWFSHEAFEPPFV
jgi:hypothetical protein